MLPVVTAHSGCEQTPDNSLAHIRAALSSDADFCKVNEEKDIRRLMKAGAMNITTRRPVLALSIRRELFEK